MNIVAMDITITKVLSLLGIFIFSILFGIAPIFLQKCVRSPKVQWINNGVICFSGGTLLGISFLHLMPETRSSVYNLMREGHFTSFPSHVSIADVVICCGFFFIYILDELIHILLEWVGDEHTHQPHGRRLSLSGSYSWKETEQKPDRRKGSLGSSKDEETQTVGNQEEVGPAVHIPGILTIVALSFHDIFEGLALGIQEHNMDVLFLFLSVATHKYAIAFSVSLDFLLSGVSAKMITIYTLCFSLVNPFGIALGIIMSLISEKENVESPMTVLMQGIASGSLIYVTCFEVLQRHGGGHGSHLTSFRNTIFVILGFVFILFMKIYLPHEHLHHNQDKDGNLHGMWGS